MFEIRKRYEIIGGEPIYQLIIAKESRYQPAIFKQARLELSELSWFRRRQVAASRAASVIYWRYDAELAFCIASGQLPVTARKYFRHICKKMGGYLPCFLSTPWSTRSGVNFRPQVAWSFNTVGRELTSLSARRANTLSWHNAFLSRLVPEWTRTSKWSLHDGAGREGGHKDGRNMHIAARWLPFEDNSVQKS